MIVLSYDYSNRNRQRWRTNAPPSRAILMAIAVRQCDMKRIPWCSMQHDQSFTGSHWTPQSGDYLLRIAPSAARATINLTMIQHVHTLLAVLIAIAMWRYYTAHIARWRRFVAFIKATKRHHRTSTRSDSTSYLSRMRPTLPSLSSLLPGNKAPLRPVNFHFTSGSMWHPSAWRSAQLPCTRAGRWWNQSPALHPWIP